LFYNFEAKKIASGDASMATIQFEFNLEKTVEMILYIANRIKTPSIMSMAKLMYFADKTSLEEYGRFISGDSYVAMQHGPVPSSTYDLMKAARDGEQYGFVIEGDYRIKPLRDANLDEFSDSDISCLERIIAIFGNYPAWQLRELSHDETWAAAWAAVGQRNSAPISVESIINHFDEAEDLLNFLKHRHQDENGFAE
jgi:uncharacterized phage-associated protein